MALVFYHRGLKARPEFDEFRLGIQKASQAISNAIGCTLANKGKKYTFNAPVGVKLVNKPPLKQKNGARLSTSDKGSLAWIAPIALKPPSTTPQPSTRPSKNEKHLLGLVFDDKSFLNEMRNDKDFTSNPNPKITALLDDALTYLDNRVEFWRQEGKPSIIGKPQLVANLHRAKLATARSISASASGYKQRAAGKLERSGTPNLLNKRPNTAPPPSLPREPKTVESVQSDSDELDGAISRGDASGFSAGDIALLTRLARTHLVSVSELPHSQNRTVLLGILS